VNVTQCETPVGRRTDFCDSGRLDGRSPACVWSAREDGFTLIELVITVVVVSLIALLAFPMAEVAVQRTKEQDLRVALRQIRGAIDAYKEAVKDKRVTGGGELDLKRDTAYPPTLKILAEGVPDTQNPKKDTKIYFLRRIPRDPMATDSSLSAEDTWGKRSYASPPDDPQEGDDVFDVYSRSTGVGLNGIPYKEW
jgi:general secretion pathway protein G